MITYIHKVLPIDYVLPSAEIYQIKYNILQIIQTFFFFKTTRFCHNILQQCSSFYTCFEMHMSH